MKPSLPLSPASVNYFLEQLTSAAEQAARQHGIFVLVGGGTWQHRTQVLREFAATRKFYYLPLGLELSRVLRNIAPQERPRRVQEIVQTLSHPPMGGDFHGCALDHIEVLFHPSLHVRVVSLLKHLARTQPLVVSWPGTYKNGRLTYAQPGHPEYQQDTITDLLYINLEA